MAEFLWYVSWGFAFFGTGMVTCLSLVSVLREADARKSASEGEREREDGRAVRRVLKVLDVLFFLVLVSSTTTAVANSYCALRYLSGYMFLMSSTNSLLILVLVFQVTRRCILHPELSFKNSDDYAELLQEAASAGSAARRPSLGVLLIEPKRLKTFFFLRLLALGLLLVPMHYYYELYKSAGG